MAVCLEYESKYEILEYLNKRNCPRDKTVYNSFLDT